MTKSKLPMYACTFNRRARGKNSMRVKRIICNSCIDYIYNAATKSVVHFALFIIATSLRAKGVMAKQDDVDVKRNVRAGAYQIVFFTPQVFCY